MHLRHHAEVPAAAPQCPKKLLLAGVGAGAGAEDGPCRPLPESFVLVCAGVVAAGGACVVPPAVCVVWPWKLAAAAADTSPDRATAPAIIQRLIRDIRVSPALRALTALGAMMSPMVETLR